uniref:Endoplasmic reticulum transmembrane protein n=1 Tax=Anas platyrhynchos platyrhynchos TaxID=8840 RepID=A0A493SSP3_ANAPP
MTFQWTAVATFLYGEVVVLLVLCLPFISPLRWQKIFMIPLWSKIAVFWNKMFLTIIVLLIILFLDAFREVRKYSAIQVTEKVANVNTNAIDHIHMKLFRSQRNLYISGFSLFLWLVLRRTITLLTQLAKSMASHAALETQVNDTTEAAKKYLAENERLQEALNERGSSGNKVSAKVTNEKLKKEVEHLRAELQKTSNGKYWLELFCVYEKDCFNTRGQTFILNVALTTVYRNAWFGVSSHLTRNWNNVITMPSF